MEAMEILMEQVFSTSSHASSDLDALKLFNPFSFPNTVQQPKLILGVTPTCGPYGNFFDFLN